jgi:hypothetical protein
MKNSSSSINANDADLIKFTSILTDKTNNGFVVLERNDKLPYAVLLKKKKRWTMF